MLASGAAHADELAPKLDEKTYEIRLADLERRVQELKDRIRVDGARRHAPLLAPCSLTIATNAGRPFALARARIVVDGVVLHDGAANQDVPLLVRFMAPIALGEHEVRVTLTYRGDDALFPYLRGYAWEVRAERTITGSDAALVVRDSGDPTLPLEKRLRALWSR
jgi:hypothetical protein